MGLTATAATQDCTSTSESRAAPRTWVLEQPQQLDLAQDPGGVRDMLKHVVNLLDGHLFAGVVVDS